MKADPANAQTFQFTKPVDQLFELSRTGVQPVQGDDQTGDYGIRNQLLEGDLRTYRRQTRPLQGVVPTRVIEFTRSVHGDAYVDRIALEQSNVLIVDEHAVGLNYVPSGTFKSPGPQILQDPLGEQQRLAAKQQERLILTAVRSDRSLHSIKIVAYTQVTRVALRILVAVTTLKIAANTQWHNRQRHESSPSMKMRRPCWRRAQVWPQSIPSQAKRSRIVQARGLAGSDRRLVIARLSARIPFNGALRRPVARLWWRETYEVANGRSLKRIVMLDRQCCFPATGGPSADRAALLTPLTWLRQEIAPAVRQQIPGALHHRGVRVNNPLDLLLVEDVPPLVGRPSPKELFRGGRFFYEPVLPLLPAQLGK